MTQATDALDLLAFAPHPDDAELFCGGLLIKMAQQGYRVGLIDLTRGEMASNGTPEERAEEAAQAAHQMRLTIRENLALPDGRLFPWSHDEEKEAADPQHPLYKIIESLRRLRPALVLVPWQEERHPDHVAASHLLTRALFFSGLRRYLTEKQSPFRPQQVLYYPMRVNFSHSFLVNISEVAQQKYEAIRCHASQIAPLGGTPTLVGSPLALEAIEARDRYYGAMIGVRYAEPYLVRSALALDDPIAHFRQSSASQAHFFERS
jgi:bacillithiol biosynthesis deacetylase BshB1